MYKNQNRRQKVFNRGFAVLRVGLFFCLGGLDIIKLTKTPLIYSVSRFNLGSWALFRGAKPTKAPRGDGTDENNGYACSKMSKRFFQGRRKFLQGCEVLPLLTGLVNRWLGMQTSHCRLDWYMGMYSERRLVRFYFDILKSSLVGLDNSAWEFDWCLERLSDKQCLDNRKGTQKHAGADKQRLKGYILHPSAVKINCK